MKGPKPDFFAILRALVEHRVEFIVVGGVCGVLHGAPISTFDLDLVHSRNSANVERLVVALGTLEARYRTPGAGERKPDRSHLSSAGHQLLMTRWGPLDLLGIVGSGRDYQELLPETTEMDLGPDLRVRVLNLRALIQIKEETAHEKDKAVLVILRRTLEEKERSGKGPSG